MEKDNPIALHGKAIPQPKLIKNRQNLYEPNVLFTNLLETYFQLTYLILWSPFKLVYQYSDGHFYLKKQSLQKFVCIVLSILGLTSKIKKQLWYFNGEAKQDYEQRHVVKSALGDPRIYLTLLSYLFGWICRIKILYLFWFRQDDFLEIANMVIYFEKIGCARPQVPLWMRRIFSKMFLRVVFFVWLAITLSSRIPNRSTMFNVFERNRNETIFELTFRILITIGALFQSVWDCVGDLVIMVAVLVVWPMSVLFAQMLRQDSTDWTQIYSVYKYIRNLCNLVNKVYGQLLSLCMADALFFFSSKLDLLITSADSTRGYQLSTYICGLVITFVLAADISENMDTLSSWLDKDSNRQGIPSDEVNIVLNNLQRSSVGIRGSVISTVTYPLLWHVVSTIFTYFIICLQSQKA